MWIHPDVLKIYDQNSISYILCFPVKEDLINYKERYIKRGNNKEYIDKVIDSYDMRYCQFKDKCKQEILLTNNMTLEDWLWDNNYSLKKF